MKTEEILRVLLVLSDEPNDLANAITRLMNEDLEFFKAMHIALFNNQPYEKTSLHRMT